jgi:serine/threonine-protein kinase RsbW
MKYKFKASCSKHKLKEIRQFVEEVLSHYDLSEGEIHKLVLAVDEVCANLMIHSHKCNPSENIELFIHVKENEGIIFEICDKGLGFNIQNYKEPTLQQIIQEKRKGGVGLILVRHIMDEVQFCCGDDQNICRLFKRLNCS